MHPSIEKMKSYESSEKHSMCLPACDRERTEDDASQAYK